MSLFVTVGTTSFDSLIQTIDNSDIHSKLYELGYRRIVMQIGRGSYEPAILNDQSTSNAPSVQFYRFKANLSNDVNEADLIISHAGAGSCLEALSARKRLLVVVNEELMHNHQNELASVLTARGHCISTTCSQLFAALRQHSTILTVTAAHWKTFPPSQTENFAKFLDNVMGFDSSQ